MTKHEALKLLTVGDNDLPFVELSKDEAKAIRDLIDQPKHPKTGAFVEFRFGSDPSKTWWPGIVSDNGRKPGVFDAEGELNPWDKIEYRRVYTVTPPPLEYWGEGYMAWHCYEHLAWLSVIEEPLLTGEYSGKHIITVTREEMEAQNEVD